MGGDPISWDVLGRVCLLFSCVYLCTCALIQMHNVMGVTSHVTCSLSHQVHSPLRSHYVCRVDIYGGVICPVSCYIL